MITPADVAHMLSHGGREHARGASEEDTLLYTSQTVITSDQEQITTVSFVKTTVRSFKRGNQADEKTQLHNEETSDNASNKEVHGASNVDSQQSENMQYGEHSDTPKTDEAKQHRKKKLVVPKPSQLAVPFAAKIARNTEQEESQQTAAPKPTTLKPATSSRVFIPKPSDMAESPAKAARIEQVAQPQLASQPERVALPAHVAQPAHVASQTHVVQSNHAALPKHTTQSAQAKQQTSEPLAPTQAEHSTAPSAQPSQSEVMARIHRAALRKRKPTPALMPSKRASNGPSTFASLDAQELPVVREYSAGGLVFDEYDRVAIIARHSRSGHLEWCLPKGHIEKGETPQETAVREVFEETGILGEVVDSIATIDYWFTGTSHRVHKLVHHFALRRIGGELTVEGDPDHEAEDAIWVRFSDLDDVLSYPNERKIAWMYAKKRNR